MRRTAGPTFTPDAAKATDATVDAAARDEAAQSLIRGHAAREAASDALIRMAEGTDEGDTGSQLPADVESWARDAARVARKAADAMRHNEETSTEQPGEVASDEPFVSETAADAIDDVVLLEARAQPTGQTPKPTRGELRHVTTGGPRHAPMRADGTTTGPTVNRPNRPSRPIVTRRTEVAKTTTSSRPTRVLSRTTAPHPSAQAAHRAGKSVATRRTFAGGARATLASGAATGSSAAGGAIASGSGGAGIAAAPVAAVLLVLLLVVVLFGAILGGGAVEEDQKRGAHRLAQTATDEYLAGEARGDYNRKGLTYSSFVRGTHGGKDDWDVCLVGWCMAQAGFVDAGLTHPYGDVGSYVAHFRHDPKLGEVHDWNAGDYVPVEGDLFVSWYSDGTQHIGIVTSCDGRWFEAVEGDVAGGPNGTYDRDEEDGHGGYVACRTRRLGQYSYTFIHPYYSEEAVTGR